MGHPAQPEEIDVSVARELWKAGDLIVDVRTPQEYAAGHIPGAVNVPLHRIPFVAAALPAGQVVTVCSMGRRSWLGAEAFARQGRTALSIRGGTKAWCAAALPVEAGGPARIGRTGRVTAVWRRVGSMVDTHRGRRRWR